MLLVKEAKSPLNFTTTQNCKLKMYRRSGTGQSSYNKIEIVRLTIKGEKIIYNQT